jgi:hypothetical protein
MDALLKWHLSIEFLGFGELPLGVGQHDSIHVTVSPLYTIRHQQSDHRFKITQLTRHSHPLSRRRQQAQG